MSTLSKQDRVALQDLVAKYDKLQRENQLRNWFPPTGPLAYTEYKKHFAFWMMGNTEVERAMICANRVGKTIAGGYEVTLHLTNLYPDWWPGVRFPYTIKAWACGDTNDTVRDIIQPVLFGPRGEIGCGMIPRRLIADVTYKRGSSEMIDTAWIQREGTKDVSIIQFKSYEQGRKTFQGTQMDLIWLDEEPAMDIYAECQIRTMGTDVARVPGQILATFTPLLGMSDVCLHFLPGGRLPNEPTEVRDADLSPSH
jgi:phage terminase large subunit-like protein